LNYIIRGLQDLGVIDFTTKIAAEHVLGIVGDKSKIRPKTLRFLSKQYSEDDYKKI